MFVIAIAGGLMFGTLLVVLLGESLEVALVLGPFWGIGFALCMIPYFRTVKKTLPFNDRDRFLRSLFRLMAELGFELYKEQSGFYEFRPKTYLTPNVAGIAFSLSGLYPVIVTCEDTEATFTGPRYAMLKITKRFPFV